MNRLDKMQPILELAEHKEQDAAKNLGKGQQTLDEARGNLESLHGYRNSYAVRFATSGQLGLSVQQLTEYRVFLQKINKAIADQERAVTLAEAALARLRQSWEDAHRHVLGMRKVVEKLVDAEVVKENKREQVEQDDRIGSRRGGSGEKTLLSILF